MPTDIVEPAPLAAEAPGGGGGKSALSTGAISADQRPAQRTVAMWICGASVAASLALRALYLVQSWRIDMSEHPVFIADEGVVGLMARHILRGAHPLFYYGQYYMGALEAYMAAAVFAVFGASMTTLRAVPTLCAIGWIPLTYVIARRLYGARAALLATALGALPSQFVFEWGFKARGGYAEHVALLLFVLYATILLMDRVTTKRAVMLGLAAGLSLWVNQLAIAYVPFYGYAILRWTSVSKKHIAVICAAAAVGMAPLIYGNIVHPLGTVRSLVTEMRSSARLAERRAQFGDEDRSYVAVPILEVVGAQSRRDGTWSVEGSITALVLVCGLLAGALKLYRLLAVDPGVFRRNLLVFAFVAATVVVGIAGFSGQPVGRYQLVLYPLLCLFAGDWIASFEPRLGVLAVAVLCALQAVQLVLPIPSDGRTPRRVLIAALMERGLHYGYGAGFMDDLVVDSGERIIVVPIERARYEPYEPLVARAENKFYLYRDDQQEKPANQVFLRYLSREGVHYRELRLGEYHILYGFAPPDKLTAAAIVEMRREVRDLKEEQLRGKVGKLHGGDLSRHS